MIGDTFGRHIGYLRLSLTDACQMRCLYCRPERHQSSTPTLTVAHYEALVRHLAAHHGLHKIRLTGGDPSMRQDLPALIATLRAVPGIDEVCLTTHGLTLVRDAKQWRDAGLSRVNVSLDSLDPQRFQALTGVRGLSRVLDGITKAQQAGLSPQINSVVVRGVNDVELPNLVCEAARRGVPLRMIELMPMGPLSEFWKGRYVDEMEMRECLWQAGLVLGEDLPQGSRAARFCPVITPEGARGTIGFITPMSCDFCDRCDRLRLGSQGEIYPCLMDAPRGSVMDAFSAEGILDPVVLEDRLLHAYQQKSEVHPAQGVAVMTGIGG